MGLMQHVKYVRWLLFAFALALVLAGCGGGGGSSSSSNGNGSTCKPPATRPRRRITVCRPACAAVSSSDIWTVSSTRSRGCFSMSTSGQRGGDNPQGFPWRS